LQVFLGEGVAVVLGVRERGGVSVQIGDQAGVGVVYRAQAFGLELDGLAVVVAD
jgi:hypothetical protein